MTTVTVTQPVQTLVLAQHDATRLTLSSRVTTVTVQTNLPLGVALTPYRKTGSQFTGTQPNTGRSITLPQSIRSNALVFLGRTILDTNGDYTLSTVTLANDTITINLPLFDDDVMLLWT